MNLDIKVLKLLKSTSFGTLFNVKELLVETPTGIQSTYYLREAEDFAIIIPFLSKDQVVMVRQYRLGAAQVSLEFPMGNVHGKKPLEMAKIELQEETGYTSHNLQYIGAFYPTTSSSTQKAWVYVAYQLESGKQRLEPTETLSVEIVTLASLSRMIKDGEIIDGPTIGDLGLYLNLFGNNAEKVR